MIYVNIPYRTDKNLSKAYNEAIRLIPENEFICLKDWDCYFLIPEHIAMIEKYTELYPDAVLTCLTNRIHPLSQEQLYAGHVSENSDLKYHIKIAQTLSKKPYDVIEIKEHLSGFLMVFNKRIWERIKFDGEGCLGIDTNFRKQLQKNHIPMYVMQNIYVFHQYRIMTGIHDKSHLK